MVPQEVAETEAQPEQGQETGGHKEAVPDQGPGDQGDDPPTPYRSKQQGTKNAHKTQKTGHDLVMFMRKSARQRSLVGASNKSLAKVKACAKKPMQKHEKVTNNSVKQRGQKGKANLGKQPITQSSKKVKGQGIHEWYKRESEQGMSTDDRSNQTLKSYTDKESAKGNQ